MLCHNTCVAIFTTLHKVYVRLNLFGKAGNVLKTAQHKGLLDISDTDKSKPFVIRILDNSTLSASAMHTSAAPMLLPSGVCGLNNGRSRSCHEYAAGLAQTC